VFVMVVDTVVSFRHQSLSHSTLPKYYRVIINYCTIVVGIGGLVECAASVIT
jgi:uncharacterized FAD-dependent dehydrogenase